jgi:Putative adhesin
VLLFAYGSTRAAGMLTRHTDTHTRTLAAAPTIVVHSDTGDIRVVAADRSDVRLTIKERRSVWGGGHVRLSGDASDLHLATHCDGVPLVDDPCDVSSFLEVPRDTSVRVAAGTGDVRADSLQGSVDLYAVTGDMRVTGTSGALRLSTITGDVHVEAPSSDIAARTRTGDIHVVASRPGTIQARAGTGDIHIAVPDLTFAVDVETGTGDGDVDVRRDDAAPRKLQAHTGTGDVRLSRDG